MHGCLSSVIQTIPLFISQALSKSKTSVAGQQCLVDTVVRMPVRSQVDLATTDHRLNKSETDESRNRGNG
jgi:hypothetical protein